MTHLNKLRALARDLERGLNTALGDGNDDLAGTIAFRQMAVDDTIERLTRRMHRSQCRAFKRAA